MNDFIRFSEFVDKAIYVNEVGDPFRLSDHQRVIFDLADDLRDEWNTFCYSTIKKSGKTTLQAIYAVKWALEHADDELILQANDYDQSIGRVFNAAVKLCGRNKIKARVLADTIEFPNHSIIKAVASDFAGEAGANHGFHGVDEPWGVTSEGGIRLLEELTPLINKPSIRFISSYAGWLNQSKWLWDVYLDAVDQAVHPEAKGKRIHDELPIFLNAEAKLFSYWDSGTEARRMPWQQGKRAESYYRQQQRTLRAGAYQRLHLNQWGSGDDKFISEEMWQKIVDEDMSPIISGATLFGGWDASTKRDSTAVVFVSWDGDKIRVACHKIFKPTAMHPIDFEEVEDYVREVSRLNTVLKIYADPHQLFSTIQKLQKENFSIEEFQQSLPRLTQMATSLFDAFNNRTLKTYPADDLKLHALNAIAVEGARGYVLKKEIAAGKIDALISLGMALRAAIEHGKDDLQATRGFNPAIHVSRERIKAMQGRIYIGQTLETPSTVVLQEHKSAVTVLAAFVSEHMSLERHLQQIVRPWLMTKAGISRGDVTGIYETTDNWGLVEVLERTIDCRWEPSEVPWESRRESLLDLLGRFVPWSYPPSPALKIDNSEARLLVEALSGKWSYEKDRRDKRDQWWFVADAFSLAVSRLELGSKAEASVRIKTNIAFDVRRLRGHY